MVPVAFIFFQTDIHTHTRARARFNGSFFWDYPGEQVPER